MNQTSQKRAVDHEQYQLDFVVVGPQKAGTTWIDEVLRRHPDVELPSMTKETFFLISDIRRALNGIGAILKACPCGRRTQQ